MAESIFRPFFGIAAEIQIKTKGMFGKGKALRMTERSQSKRSDLGWH